MVAHEYAHAEAAYRQGDDTAYMLGRLTLNPLKHIDPFLTVLLPVMPWIALDGSHVFYHLLPPGAGLRYRQLYMFGFLPILVISWLAPGVIGAFLWPAHRLMELGLTLVGGFALPGTSPL